MDSSHTTQTLNFSLPNPPGGPIGHEGTRFVFRSVSGFPILLRLVGFLSLVFVPSDSTLNKIFYHNQVYKHNNSQLVTFRWMMLQRHETRTLMQPQKKPENVCTAQVHWSWIQVLFKTPIFSVLSLNCIHKLVSLWGSLCMKRQSQKICLTLMLYSDKVNVRGLKYVYMRSRIWESVCRKYKGKGYTIPLI